MKHGISKAARRAIITVVIIVLLFGAAGYFGYRYLDKSITDKFTQQVKTAEDALKSQQRNVLVTTKAINAGEVLTEENTEMRTVYSSMAQGLFAGNDAIGKKIKVDVPEGAQIISAFVAHREAAADARELEYECVAIASNIGMNDYVDVRIKYPDGTDYIVLSKKLVTNITETGAIRFEMNEEEILTMDSALVDAYLYSQAYSSDTSESAYEPQKNSMLYLTKYIEPTVQDAGIVTYVPSVQSMTLIKADPNVVAIANSFLIDSMRLEKELNLINYRITNVKTENLEEFVGLDEYNEDFNKYINVTPLEQELGNVDSITND